MKISVCFLILLISSSSLWAQNSASDSLDTRKDAPRIFLDCNSCDRDYVRTEIPFVNYVRDRQESQVHVMVTRQRTGSGGREYTFTFIGRKNFTGLDDTLHYVSGKTDTEDEVRKGKVKILKLGLARYVARTPAVKDIALTYKAAIKKAEVTDKWDYWVFGVRGNTFANGQKSSSSYSLFGTAYANRITPQWKMRFRIRGNFSENRFDFGSTTITSISKSSGMNGSVIKSLGSHWSAGIFGGYYQSSYGNIAHTYNTSAAVEYYIFPYSESTRKAIRIEYGIEESYTDYDEETIYFKKNEFLTRHHFSITLAYTQPWGSISTSFDARQYLHDLSKNQVSLFNSFNWRLFNGFSLHLTGSISRIHDQLALARSGADEQEVLLRQKELATTYSYFTSFGISYTFGSIYSNVVNSRFGSGGGGGYRISISY